MRRPWIPLCTALVAAACNPSSANPDDATPDGGGSGGTEQTVEDQLPAGVAELMSSMDTSADPCQDFYQYACGGWMQNTTRPPDKPRYSRSFTGISERNETILKAALEDAATNPGESRPKQLAGAFYQSCVDGEAASIDQVKPLLDEIAGIKDKKALMGEVGKLHATVYGRVSWLARSPRPLFSIYVDADPKDPKTNILHVSQGGLGLPSRDLYLDESEGAKAIRAAYVGHIETMLGHAGMAEDKVKGMGEAVLAFETELAKASRAPEEMRDPDKTYNLIGYKGLTKKGKGLDWTRYVDNSGMPKSDAINVAVPEFFSGMSKAVRKAKLDVLKAYLTYHVLGSLSDTLGKQTHQKAFELTKVTQGVDSMPERWKHCINATMFALPDAVGPLFVEQAFQGESKAIAGEMIQGIYGSMEASFPNLEWMDDTTRGRATEKIGTIQEKIGYPDKWESYEGVELTPASYYQNSLAERSAHAKRQWAKVGKPVDKGEWAMPAPLVNAYYNPTNNEIAFPAGILQPPFFHADQPAAMNYGGIGAVIGHELTHGFDDSGRKYDKDGKLEEWWEPEVSARFEERVACVVEQYDAYEALPGANVNGKLTAGENIADIGGVKEAYYAYKAWEEQNGAETIVPELSNDQVFFVAWAQNWCSLQSDEATRRRLETDPHSPGRFRAEGPVSILPAFWDAFQCSEGTKMHPANACEVW